jgi:hypothetical protein
MELGKEEKKSYLGGGVLYVEKAGRQLPASRLHPLLAPGPRHHLVHKGQLKKAHRLQHVRAGCRSPAKGSVKGGRFWVRFTSQRSDEQREHLYLRLQRCLVLQAVTSQTEICRLLSGLWQGL